MIVAHLHLMMILYDLECLTMVFLSEVPVNWLPGEAECTSNNNCTFNLKARGALDIAAFTGRLRLKGLPFSGFKYVKGRGF